MVVNDENIDTMKDSESYSLESEDELPSVDSESDGEVSSDDGSNVNSEFSTSESETESIEENGHTLLLAKSPKVLEQSVFIHRLPGIPLQMRHNVYHLCGNKTIHRHFIRSDKGNISVHYFHLFAVQNIVLIFHSFQMI